jgi:hypothetical protein
VGQLESVACGALTRFNPAPRTHAPLAYYSVVGNAGSRALPTYSASSVTFERQWLDVWHTGRRSSNPVLASVPDPEWPDLGTAARRAAYLRPGHTTQGDRSTVAGRRRASIDRNDRRSIFVEWSSWLTRHRHPQFCCPTSPYRSMIHHRSPSVPDTTFASRAPGHLRTPNVHRSPILIRP